MEIISLSQKTIFAWDRGIDGEDATTSKGPNRVGGKFQRADNKRLGSDTALKDATINLKSDSD